MLRHLDRAAARTAASLAPAPRWARRAAWAAGAAAGVAAAATIYLALTPPDRLDAAPHPLVTIASLWAGAMATLHGTRLCANAILRIAGRRRPGDGKGD